jgi:peptide/nickel transport system ATP-binding protein
MARRGGQWSPASGDAVAASTDGGLKVSGLTVVYGTSQGELPAVSDVDLDIPAGQITGLVGESGSGKSTLALALLNAVQQPGRIVAGSIEVPLAGDITKARGQALRRARGRSVGYVFQASQNSLNPLKRVGAQLMDLGKSHGVADPRGLLKEAGELCTRMGMDASRVLASYQHELSGGMRQRVGIVFALILNARVLILDEPTTALDMLSQAAVLEIIRDVHRERQLTTLIVTHDIAVVAELADRLAVMYAGRVVEEGDTREIVRHPQHPYTRGLIGAIPRVTGDVNNARALGGRPPDLASIATRGCVFRDRCSIAVQICAQEVPPLAPCGGSGAFHVAACHVEAPLGSRPRRARDREDELAGGPLGGEGLGLRVGGEPA